MMVKVDFREKPGIREMLRTGIKGAEVIETDLQIGDIMVETGTKNYIIERKTADDYISSLQDGRLFRQVKDMSRVKEEFICIIMVEKAQDISKMLNFKRVPYYRLMSTEMWIAEKGVSVIKMFRTTDLVYLINRAISRASQHDTAEDMGSLALQVKMLNRFRGGDVRSEAIGMLCVVKGVGPLTAMKVMKGRPLIDVLMDLAKEDHGLKLTKPQRERLQEVLNYIEEGEEDANNC